MLTPKRHDIPVRYLSERYLTDSIQPLTDKKIRVSYDSSTLIIFIDEVKVVLPDLVVDNITVNQIIFSLKEKGIIKNEQR